MRAVLLEPVRVRSDGSSVARVRLAGRAQFDVGRESFRTDDLAGEVAVAHAADGRSRPDVRVGSELHLRGTVAPLGDFDAYQRRRGAGAAIDVVSWGPTGGARGGLPGGWTRRASGRCAGSAPGWRRPRQRCCAAWCSGRTRRSAATSATEFQRSGLAHLLAVSGQNVLLLCTLVLALCAVLDVPLRARLVAAARARRRVRAAGGRRAVDPARRGDGDRRARRRARRAPGVALVRARARRGGDARAQPARGRRSGLAALVRGGRRAARAGAAAAGALPRGGARAGRRRRRDHGRRDARDRAADGAALRAGLARVAAGEPARRAGRRAGDVARHARHRGRPGRAALAAPLNVALRAAAGLPAVGGARRGRRAARRRPGAAAAARSGSRSRMPVAGCASDSPWPGCRRAPAALVASRGGRGRAARGGRDRTRAHRASLVARRDGRGGRRRRAAVRTRPAQLAPGELVVSFLDVGQGDAVLLQRDAASRARRHGTARRARSCAGSPRPASSRLDVLVLTHAEADHEGMALPVIAAHPPADRARRRRGLADGRAARAARGARPRRRAGARRARRPGAAHRRAAVARAVAAARRRRAGARRATRTTAPSSRTCRTARSTCCCRRTPRRT